ncbi:MAG: kinase, partial [Lachnospiraceae bacterium]|nr:kinase [Lachnospiraceae bacterium]
MIIARSPLRISLGGGGTDLPSYYEQREGFLISAAIDKYVYLTLHQTFEEGFFLKYSKFERVQSIDEIQHPIIREALKMLDWKDNHIEI